MILLHHIAGDGWAMNVLLVDLATAYAARNQGQQPSWAPLPAQYADYTLWQHRLLGDHTDPGSLFARQVPIGPTPWRGYPNTGAAHRPSPSGRRLLSRRCLSDRLGSPVASGIDRPGPPLRDQPVHGAAGRVGRVAIPAGRGHRHPDR